MATAARYSRAIRDLQAKTSANDGLMEQGDEGTEEAPGRRARRPKPDPKTTKTKPPPQPKA